MGDRSNPIKFGPEWLRNFSREGSAGAAGGGGGLNPSAPASSTNTQHTHKVQLAKLRYGREEFLALYDGNAEPPGELKQFDLLFNPRGKPPFALSSTYDDEMRDNMRGSTAGGGSGGAPGDRFGPGRGQSQSDARAWTRLPFTRSTNAARGAGYKSGTGGPLGFERGGEEGAFEAPPTLGRWSAQGSNNGGNAPPGRNGPEQAEWQQKNTFRNRWQQGATTNWRRPQSSRDEGDEWRTPDNTRLPRPQQEKWERDWAERGDRGLRDKQGWHNNRRTWGGDNPNEENLPEWAMDNTDACGGTFDSSGAFHGFSNDDSNIPKPQSEAAAYPITRSHTQGSFARSKAPDEGSDEWWASEKAKKLSPKRFDTKELSLKKQLSEPNASISSPPPDDHPPEKLDRESAHKLEREADSEALAEARFKKNFQQQQLFKQQQMQQQMQQQQLQQQQLQQQQLQQQQLQQQQQQLQQQHQQQQQHQHQQQQQQKLQQQQEKMTERKRFEALMRSDVSGEEAGDERGNFKSVMITGNNALRQKHQNIGTAPNEPRPSAASPAAAPAKPPPPQPTPDSDVTQKIIDDMLDFSFEDKEAPLHEITPPKLSPPVAYAEAIMGRQTMVHSPPTNNLSLGPHQPKPLPPTIPMPPSQSQYQPSLGIGAPSLPHSMPGRQSPGLPSNSALPGFTANGMTISAPVAPNSLFMQNGGNIPMPPSSDLHRQSQVGPAMYPMHNLPSPSANYATSLYGNMMHSPSLHPPAGSSLADQWYYEDPAKTVQGPFSSKDMYGWYRSGFFTSSLMVRRACEHPMRPLGSYGPIVPFAVRDNTPPYPVPRLPGQRDAMMSAQQSMGLGDVVMNARISQEPSLDALQFGSVGNNFIRSGSFNQPPIDSLWGQASPSTAEMLWMQQPMPSRTDPAVNNNLSMYFWDKPSMKEMKTEDQILAQLRAQSMKPEPGSQQPFLAKEHQGAPILSPGNEARPQSLRATPDLNELEKLIQKDALAPQPVAEVKEQLSQAKELPESEFSKPAQSKGEKTKTKAEEKPSKNKDAASSKGKTKKEKRDEAADAKKDDETVNNDRKSAETSPSKFKKEDKQSKKQSEIEKKEWLKDGFTIVKGPEKTSSKDAKKKAEEAKATEEAERKRREEEKAAAEEEKRLKQAEAKKQQQEQQAARQAETVTKKAPWSAVATGAQQASSREGPTLAEIQRLEREKKLEQMKEQQAMMQIIAQQQQAALAREQEMQANLGWAKKKNQPMAGQSLAEIQAEARKQAATAAASAAAAAAAAAPEELPAPAQPASAAPWGGHNGGGFWETERQKPQEKVPEPPKQDPPTKTKKKAVTAAAAATTPATAPASASASAPATAPAAMPARKQRQASQSPAHEFENWCASVLGLWSEKIDVPTFVSFLKDIESPFEVKEYAKCYLGESKDSIDFARQFLERRSKLLRAHTETPVDDLASPAAAVNPRAPSASDYQEGKGKKPKKNKMVKLDVRILGFSVTAAEDRINVGDIDSV